MPANLTDYTRTKLLGHTLGFASWPMPASVYVGLCTTASTPTNALPGTEVVGGNYARKLATFAMVVASLNQAANSVTIEWLPATASWGTIGWFELWDALTAGNRLIWGPTVDPTDGITPSQRQIRNGDIMRLPAGALIISDF